jgi:hypothetical protein
LLEFLSDWLEFDHENLTASLARFVGSPGYGPDTLRGDFARFRFLLGVTDGEGVFTRTSHDPSCIAGFQDECAEEEGAGGPQGDDAEALPGGERQAVQPGRGLGV